MELLALLAILGIFFIPGFFAALVYWIFKLVALCFKLAFAFWQVALFILIIGLICSIF